MDSKKVKRLLKDDDYILISNKGGQGKETRIWFLQVCDIKYISSDGANINIVFSKKIERERIQKGASGIPSKIGTYFLQEDETARYFCGIGEIRKRLAQINEFIETDRGHIVNARHIESVSVEDGVIEITLYGGYKFPMEEKRAGQFQKIFKLSK